MNDPKRLLIVTNVDWFLISHRLIIAKAAVKAGWQVFVACEDTGRGKEIAVDGIEFIPLSISRSGLNPITEFKTYKSFVQLYKRIQPDVVHQITIKPVVYGGIAAKKANIRGVVNAISGLGYMFTGNRLGMAQRFILNMMKRGFNRSNVSVIFQNYDDKNALAQSGVLQKDTKVYVIKGSGIDLQFFAYTALPPWDRIKILLPSRMLWDKGIKELREASEILKDKYSNKIQFLLVGMADNNNKAGVPEEYLREWEDGDYVIWKGHQKNVLEFYRQSHIVVLPSYREGLPKTLIEACAVGRPIVTTNAIGCKDCVDEGVNGYKVDVGNGVELAEALEKLILDHDMMQQMGKAGRKKAELEFDVNDVINKHLEIYQSVSKA